MIEVEFDILEYSTRHFEYDFVSKKDADEFASQWEQKVNDGEAPIPVKGGRLTIFDGNIPEYKVYYRNYTNKGDELRLQIFLVPMDDQAQ